MSLAIDIERVAAVLLADGWHTVADASFTLDSYEYTCFEELVHGGGSSGVCATGFSFFEDLDQNAGTAYQGDKVRFAGPLISVLAVMER